MIQTSRRNFILGASALIAAPSIVRPGILMPIKSILTELDDFGVITRLDVLYSWMDVRADWNLLIDQTI